MVERFQALATRGRLHFEVWFSRRTRPDRSWHVDEEAWNFPYRYLPQLHVGGKLIGMPVPLIRGPRPDVLVGLHGEPTFLPAWTVARARGVATAVYVERTFDVWVTRRRWKEGLKRQIFPRLDGVLSPGRDGDRFAETYGAPGGRVHRIAGFSSFPHFAAGARAGREKRVQLRAELGLRGVTFLYVGRLLPSKGLDVLLDAFAVLHERLGEGVELLVVGDGPEAPTLRQRSHEQQVSTVKFLGFWQREDLPALYAAADVFVFPTLGDAYGQVVEEAMSCSLPVVSTSAAGEIDDRIEDGVTGYLVPPGDSAALLDRMALLAGDGERRARIGEAAFKKVSRLTPDVWAAQFEDAIHRIAMDRGRERSSGRVR